MAKTASLTAGLVAKKGEATPATRSVATLSGAEKLVVSASKSIEANDPVVEESRLDPYYKALTVKLDRARYEALKNAGVRFDKKSQEIFVEALDLWLKRSVDQLA